MKIAIVDIRASLSRRLSFFYAAQFTAIGIQLPFWPLYLSAKGLGAAEIGQILSATYFIKILTNPLAAHSVDRYGRRRPTIIVLIITSILLTIAFAFVDGFWPLLLLTTLATSAFAAMIPLGESLSMESVASHHLDYGRIRLWGSLSFSVVVGFGGLLLIDVPSSMILLSRLTGLGLTLAAAIFLLEVGRTPTRIRYVPIGTLLLNRPFLIFVMAAGLIDASHMVYIGFATLHWRAAGLSGGMIGLLWAEGVIAELLVFAFGGKLISRLGPVLLLAAAGVASVIRWAVFGTTTSFWALALVQLLFSFAFGAVHLCSMYFILRTVPPSLSARAQSIYATAIAGIVPGIAMFTAGELYGRIGGNAFLVMSAVAACGFGVSLFLSHRWNGVGLVGGEEA
jgi:PPP family 3-phenylpropionic acid transporter